MRKASLLLPLVIAVAPAWVHADDAFAPAPPRTSAPAGAATPTAAAPTAPAPIAAPATPAITTAAPPRVFAKPKPKLPDLPVKLTIVTRSPDPPWQLRIVNEGDRTIRIPADSRLLSFEVTKAASTDKKQPKPRAMRCTLPRALSPDRFPQERALYLKAGESYEEWFDPRLYCFGATTDALKAGTTVVAEWGFPKSRVKGAFAAEGTDRPADHENLRAIRSEPFVLPAVVGNPLATPLAPAKPDEEDGDRNVARMEVFLDRFSDASVSRDVVVNLKASNEGKRALLTVLRSRMLEFQIEHLGADNTPMSTVDCPGAAYAHATAIEMLRDLPAGKSATIPVLLSEFCPRGTFDSPGLYRVRARLDAKAAGEVERSYPYVGEALALQQTLVRVASARLPFYHTPPRLEQRATPAPGPAGDDGTRRPPAD